MVVAEVGLTDVWDRLTKDARSESTFLQLTLACAAGEPLTCAAGLALAFCALEAVVLLELHAAISITLPASRAGTALLAVRVTVRCQKGVVVDRLLIASWYPSSAIRASPAAGDSRRPAAAEPESPLGYVTADRTGAGAGGADRVWAALWRRGPMTGSVVAATPKRSAQEAPGIGRRAAKSSVTSTPAPVRPSRT
jgi:hypothetical protein